MWAPTSHTYMPLHPRCHPSKIIKGVTTVKKKIDAKSPNAGSPVMGRGGRNLRLTVCAARGNFASASRRRKGFRYTNRASSAKIAAVAMAISHEISICGSGPRVDSQVAPQMFRHASQIIAQTIAARMPAGQLRLRSSLSSVLVASVDAKIDMRSPLSLRGRNSANNERSSNNNPNTIGIRKGSNPDEND